MKRAFAIACVLFGIFGCGGDDKAPFVPHTRKDSGPDDTKRDAAVVDDAGMTEGPLLKFTMPEAAKDPKEDTVVTSPLITVRCEAKERPGKSKVNAESVAITLDKVDEDGAKEEAKPATTKFGDNEFEAKFDVSGRPNGLLSFRCAAKDSAPTPNASVTTLSTLLDLGPKVEILQPKDEGIYPLRTPITIQFQVTPSPLGEGDDEAAVKDVKLLISGMSLPVTEADDKPGFYQTSIDFNDAALFMVPPTSAEVLVTATDSRTPEPVTRSVKYDVKIDGIGPSITVDSPMNGSIVHGEVTLRLAIADVSGVMPGSVRAEINKDMLTITEWDIMGSTYRATFDTRQFGLELTQLTINVTATDVVGNQATVGHLLRLDNVAPIISLDPPDLIELRKIEGGYVCSYPFDPAGDYARSDLDKATVSSVYRAIVMDDTNRSPGAPTAYLAGVANSKVVLYAQPDPTVPLLIDTDGDHICDEINFDALPEMKRPTIRKLTTVTPRGSSWFPMTMTDSGSCKANPGGALMAPGGVCGELAGNPSYFPRVIAAQVAGRPPIVYAMDPTNETGGDCAGGSWELLPIVGEGWACLAVRAEDTIGNIGVSAPLRICFDDGNGTAACNPTSDTPPTCTDGCANRYSKEIWPANTGWPE